MCDGMAPWDGPEDGTADGHAMVGWPLGWPLGMAPWDGHAMMEWPPGMAMPWWDGRLGWPCHDGRALWDSPLGWHLEWPCYGAMAPGVACHIEVVRGMAPWDGPWVALLWWDGTDKELIPWGQGQGRGLFCQDFT